MFEESSNDAWRARFGAEPPDAASRLGRFLTHRSVREYADRHLEEGLLSALVGVAQSASTSSNLQLWSIVSVQGPGRREQIARLCDDQDHVRRAPWFLAFLADHHRLKTAASAVGEECLGLDYNEFYTMAVLDAAIAAERLVCAAESLGIGVCYIGALRNDVHAVRDLLALPPGTVGLFGLCLGWPADSSTAKIKPRMKQESIWFREQYGVPDVEEYDDRMRAFYESQRMKGSVTWTMRSGRRVDEHHLTGRQALKPFLSEQGFDKR